MKVDKLSVAAGIILIVLGVVLSVVGMFFPFVFFYSIPLLIMGIVILATLKEQEHIEPIKKNKKKNRRS